LARQLVNGELDVALVPVFEAIRSPEFLIVDGLSISARGPVWSVFVAHQEPLEQINQVYLDPASLTSANLCKVIFAEFVKTAPQFLAGTPPEDAARLLIGNQAIDFRAEQGSRYQYLDFGEEWLRQTGLPFVFAVWLMRPDVAEPEKVAEAFRHLACAGQEQLKEIVEAERTYPHDFTLRYLTEHIRYGLGDEEKRGMERFRELLAKHGVLANSAKPFRFC
jgi:chorismate dehydratase